MWDVDLPYDFDAVVGRWVLMYVEEPGRLLHQVAAHLRPGGIVAFQESANLKAAVETYPPTPTARRDHGAG